MKVWKKVLSVVIIFSVFLVNSVLAANHISQLAFCVTSSAIWRFVGYILLVVRVAIPVIIIVLGIVDLAKVVMGSDDDLIAKATKNLIRRFILGIAIFFVPLIVSVAMSLISSATTYMDNIEECHVCLIRPTSSDCRSAVNEAKEDRKNRTEASKGNSGQAVSGAICYYCPDRNIYIWSESSLRNCTISYAHKTESECNNAVSNSSEGTGGSGNGSGNTSGNGSTPMTNPSTGDGTILLLAGHSYPPYCNQMSNECRGAAGSGYAEEDETRAFAKLIKNELEDLGVEADIGNELMAGDGDAKMNTSFYVEYNKGTSAFNSIDWSKYSYVLEIHFNASSNGTADGTVILINSGSSALPIDTEIVAGIVKYTGNTNRGVVAQNTSTYSYFSRLGVPVTYLETEFYDNKTAMDKFKQNSEEIAEELAKLIKEHYGS